ncbi:hypothetical protein [Cellulophaga sp. BC115SP]|uniref:hypothetical protein n=1 Tax=Cellulophaga sp. BC115SP TaxID=2683263 RepID=UPI001412CD90|nr:hypothetical protein [Cellulophaga sp. BC115SP]NBB28902.1 hypothetical protein [Cellulophaga sp. BC115SP]
MKEFIHDKVTKILFTIPLATNLARKKTISDILLGLIESRKVQFHEIALYVAGKVKTASTERRIQGFFKDFNFDFCKVCCALALFLPQKKVFLSIDRTEWDGDA